MVTLPTMSTKDRWRQDLMLEAAVTNLEASLTDYLMLVNWTYLLQRSTIWQQNNNAKSLHVANIKMNYLLRLS